MTIADGGVSLKALYTFDYLITFPREIQLLWGRNFNAVSLILILNRYIPFVTFIIFCYSVAAPQPESTEVRNIPFTAAITDFFQRCVP